MPEEDRAELTAVLTGEVSLGSTAGAQMDHAPLTYLYDRFSDYIADRRAAPRADVMSEMAAAGDEGVPVLKLHSVRHFKDRKQLRIKHTTQVGEDLRVILET
mgnify:CR=1 FL=1